MMRCAGCGSTETLKQIRAKRPQAISCCPERKMKLTCRYVQGREHTGRGASPGVPTAAHRGGATMARRRQLRTALSNQGRGMPPGPLSIRR
jgi:hypothetical protein